MITLLEMKNNIKEAKVKYNKAKKISISNLEKIKNGCKFGYEDKFSLYEAYFPLTLLEIIDEENCLIKVIEKGNPNAKEEIIDTYDIILG